jgi:hypothetical protein
MGNTNIRLLEQRLLSSMAMRLGRRGRLFRDFGHKTVPRIFIHDGRGLYRALKGQRVTVDSAKPPMWLAVGLGWGVPKPEANAPSTDNDHEPVAARPMTLE